MAHTITTEEETRSIATVSASSDEFIGNLISEAVEKVGRSGVITIEEGKTTDTALELVEGLQFDRGYISAYFCSNAEKMITEMANPKVLIVDKKISNIHEILPLLQSSMSSGSELLIIAEDVEGDALSTLVVNRLRGTLRAAAVKAPGFGDRRKAMLQDIATLTGATVISDDTGISLKEVGTEVLGAAEKITLTKENTTIIGGAGTTDAIAARIKEIDAETAAASSSYDKEKLQERKAKLSGGVAVIRVGAATEPEVKQLKQVFEDSLSSTQAALAEGVVTGGGVALLRASQALKKLSLEGDEAIGLQIVQEACQAPLRQIVTNTGDDASVALQEVLASTDLHTGFNALTGEITNLFNAGVIDAVKVIKHALSSAASVAGIVLISEAIITDAEEDEES